MEGLDGWYRAAVGSFMAILVLTLPGCELAVLGAAGGAVYSVAEDRRSPSVQLDDETIQVRVRSRVGDRFGGKVHLTVTSFNRMALLTGEAPDEATRGEIGRIALGVPNVRAVANEMQLSAPSSTTSRIGDEIITAKVKGRILDSGKVNLVHVKVITEAGVVYLAGLVTEKEAEDAVNIARTTSGVLKVVKLFEYCSDGADACRARRQAPELPRPAS